MQNPLRDPNDRLGQLEPCVLVIVGATGDLAKRKLAPAIWNLRRLNQLPANFAILGCSRRGRSDEQFRETFREAVRDGDADFDEQVFAGLAERMFYRSVDFADAASVAQFGQAIGELQQQHGLADNVLFYLATPAQQFESSIRAIGQAGLAPRPAGWARVIIEKPFGYDLASARQLNAALREVFGEANTYRIDHYLGKETVQNLMVLRFGNSIFELMWDRGHVDHVQITVAETLGVEGRAEFFEQTGILRDIAQNHLMQLLALTAMEPPVGASPDGVRDEKVKVLRSLRPLSPQDVVVGQYAAGAIEGEQVIGYRDEPDVPADSTADTYVAVRTYVDNWRWAGVPFYLRCGKRLAKKATEIGIQFREPPLTLFGQFGEQVQPNRLLIRIQPDEGIAMLFGSKVPGPAMRIQAVKMDFRYGASFGRPLPDAYQRLLLDVMVGDSTLFLRADEVEQAWVYFEPILEAWARGDKPLAFYPAGSWGPSQADALLVDPRHQWRRL